MSHSHHHHHRHPINTCPPSPTPPWARPPVTPITDTLVDDGIISISTLTTYLNQTAPKEAVDDVVPPYLASLADGTYKQQRKVIAVPASAADETSVWRVTGNFVGFISLRFDSVNTIAELVWDGTGAWSYIGGNAIKEDQ